jgi:hypothetical protein
VLLLRGVGVRESFLWGLVGAKFGSLRWKISRHAEAREAIYFV